MTRLNANINQPGLQAKIQDSAFIDSLFKPVQRNIVRNPDPANPNDPLVKPGSLITFGYLFRKRDPYPMVIVTRIEWGKYIKGVNLNYLTMALINELIGMYGDKTYCQWFTIKGMSPLINESFREYKWQGIRQLRKFNSQFLLSVINMARNFDPFQAHAMRNAVREQIRQQINPKAQEITEGRPIYTQQGAPQPQGAFPTVPTITPRPPIG